MHWFAFFMWFLKQSFQKKLLKYLNKNNITFPVYYHIGSRICQIIYSPLRLECSTLKLHMLNRNICPSFFCLCGSVKNIDHYLLHCPKYATVRKITILENALANSTDPNLLLYLSNYNSIVENQRFPFRTKIYTCQWE